MNEVLIFGTLPAGPGAGAALPRDMTHKP